jgi:hypothetical protein
LIKTKHLLDNYKPGHFSKSVWDSQHVRRTTQADNWNRDGMKNLIENSARGTNLADPGRAKIFEGGYVQDPIENQLLIVRQNHICEDMSDEKIWITKKIREKNIFHHIQHLEKDYMADQVDSESSSGERDSSRILDGLNTRRDSCEIGVEGTRWDFFDSPAKPRVPKKDTTIYTDKFKDLFAAKGNKPESNPHSKLLSD